MIKQLRKQSPENQGLILYVSLNAITIALVSAIIVFAL